MKFARVFLLVVVFVSGFALAGDLEDENFHLEMGNGWIKAANELNQFIAQRTYYGASAHVRAQSDINQVAEYLSLARARFRIVNQYRAARRAPLVGLPQPPHSIRYRYQPEPTYYRSYSTLSLSPSLGSSSSAGSTTTAKSKSGGTGWSFVGCYSQSDAYDKCRNRFENDKWCRDSHLGTGYECLSSEKTAPRACYCWR